MHIVSSSQPLGSGGHCRRLHPAIPLRWIDSHPQPGAGPSLGTLSIHPGGTLLLQLHRHRPGQRYQDAVETVNWGDSNFNKKTPPDRLSDRVAFITNKKGTTKG